MPYAFLLAVTAGLLTFIPTIGPVFAGIPIVLAGFSKGPEMALWGIGAYAAIELVEGNFVTPLIQKRAVELAPAFTLAFQLLMGALFGILGIALAVPLAAAGKVFVDELYVKDTLGGPSRAGEAELPE
jgi:predicted PurR-regulated permease PerM